MQGPVIAGSQGDPNNGKSTMEHIRETCTMGTRGELGVGYDGNTYLKSTN